VFVRIGAHDLDFERQHASLLSHGAHSERVSGQGLTQAATK
jgi:hypothetical protein